MEQTIIDEFWKNVEKTPGCWNWKGKLRCNAPTITYKTKNYSPRKISIQLAGIITNQKRLKPVICKNNLCVNPTHLVVDDRTYFWNNVQKLSDDKCWNWKGLINTEGYPIMRFGSLHNSSRITYSPRKLSLQISGIVIPNHTMISVKCRNKLCVNPKHLLWNTIDRFWNQVQKTEDCWIWTGYTNSDMYGQLSYHKNSKNIVVGSHIYSWELYTGRQVPKGILVCHHCDHPWCVNPQHLFLGTKNDNTQDMVSKGRQNRGSTVIFSKLTEDKVKLIRELRQSGIPVSQLSKQFTVSKTAIKDVVSRKTWKHIP